MDMYHEIALQLYDGRLHLAPLKDPQKILDIGTGTGIWAIDMADTYPMAEVIGIDLSPTQPGWVPPNCKFEVDDAEQDWTFQPDSFDFIHARNIAQGVSDWPRLVSQAYRCTKPDGYVELSEVGQTAFCDDGTMADDNPIKVYLEILTDAMTKFGRPPVGDNTLKENLESAGFVDIKTNKKKEPIGPWAKDKRLKSVGTMTLLNGEEAFHSYGMMAFTRILGMETEAAEKLCRDAVQAMYNKNHHIYFCNYVAYGRKPEKPVSKEPKE
ncbi:S-adenosyl-L-methionine-dependent methyltransferase [Wilcoxina mikolae CBS 423.85]|nr:S-adenosyl-L-methionine-dependent methyltransferase [Wilcoxina mikolae CBS 423.85]